MIWKHFADNIFKRPLAHFPTPDLRRFDYFYPIRIILHTINDFFAHSEIVSKLEQQFNFSHLFTSIKIDVHDM